MRCSNDNITVDFDLETGYTSGIYFPGDEFSMNWVLENSDWGKVDGFKTERIEKTSDGIVVYAKNELESLNLTVSKTVNDKAYSETYRITNNNVTDYFTTKDSFGIHFPYNSTFEGKENMHDGSCVTHVWCGENISWMYSAKPSGTKPYLNAFLKSGSICNYSISYDLDRVIVGSSYRGALVLIPTPCILSPDESLEISFDFEFSDISPDTNHTTPLRLYADSYSAFAGDTINCFFECDEYNADIYENGKKVEFIKEGNTVKWQTKCTTPGEILTTAKWNNKETHMNLNILPPLCEILRKRAFFIATKQQFHKKGSHLDGAYLVYDRMENRLCYSESFGDSNACRERLSMGVTILLALQEKEDAILRQSIEKHREFIEREVYDEKTATVFNSIARNNKHHRAYNYPWMSVYYLEWYHLTGEIKCLENSARIMISYYEKAKGGKQESPCMRLFEICTELEKANLSNLKEKLVERIFAHADKVLTDNGKCFSHEVTCTQFMFLGKINILCQAYMLSGNRKYLDAVEMYIPKTDAFRAFQPDFHTNTIAVRYWDLFWFGKYKSYGDSMPQWLSSLAAETYDFLFSNGFGEKYKKQCRDILLNNLCVFADDGFASAGYLVPYKVEQYSAKECTNICMKPQITYSHGYDDYANDQDWALYFAVKLIC